MAPPPRRRMMMAEDSDDDYEGGSYGTPQGGSAPSTASSSRSTSRVRGSHAPQDRVGTLPGRRTTASSSAAVAPAASPSTRIGRPTGSLATQSGASRHFGRSGTEQNPIQLNDEDEDDERLVDLDHDDPAEEDIMDIDDDEEDSGSVDDSAFNLSGGAAFPLPRAWRNSAAEVAAARARFNATGPERGGRASTAAARRENVFGNPYGQQYPGGMGGLLAGGGLGMMGMGSMNAAMRMHAMGGSSGSYDQSFRAFSMAMMDAPERENVSYGGKIIMPPSALATLSALEFESPMLFQLRNPTTDAEGQERKTHGGVLEFIAEEGRVYLPGWMMRGLALDEGDPIVVKGASLPRGKLIKIQPQTVDFLEISDPKAVLEQALRNYSTLTKGDIIEISYNSLIFEILILEIQPDSERAQGGISITETDLEVDFAAPKGYVEPERPKPRPLPTMASRMGIDTRAKDSRPSSALGSASSAAFVSGSSTPTSFISSGGAFRGGGHTLSGRTTHGTGVNTDEGGQEIEAMDPLSKATRTTHLPRVIKPEQLPDRRAGEGRAALANGADQGGEKAKTNDANGADGAGAGAGAAAALRLPFGTLFFGYEYIPPKPPTSTATSAVGGRPDDDHPDQGKDGPGQRDDDSTKRAPVFQGQANRLRG